MSKKCQDFIVADSTLICGNFFLVNLQSLATQSSIWKICCAGVSIKVAHKSMSHNLA